MDFDDSFFENDNGKEDKKKKTNETSKYYPKICEPEWFVTLEAEKYDSKQDSEQILKHQADWLFMKKQFKGALVKYQQLLSTVTIPIIIHQVTASIARCHAHLKQWDEASEYAKRSLQSPHNKDPSQLLLLGQIHSNQGDDYAAIQAIQEAVCQQRYNHQLWMALSRVCVYLSNNLKSTQERNNTKADKCNETLYLEEASVDIVKKSIIVMKPHFKLRHTDREENSSTIVDSSHGAAAVATTGEDQLWIIGALGAAMADNNNHSCVIKIADSQLFPHFLIILSCGSCLWARSILTHCQRHSSSFHLSKVSADMNEVQVMLSNHPHTLVTRMSQCVVQVYDGTIGVE